MTVLITALLYVLLLRLMSTALTAIPGTYSPQLFSGMMLDEINVRHF